MSTRTTLTATRRLIVKVGSQLLADDPDIFVRLATEIASLWREGREVVLVTSGAIALGFPVLGLPSRPRDLASLQAAAAAGQGRLMARWGAAFEAAGRPVAQVLLTHADLASRRRYLNARSALMTLLGAGVVPVINENDTVSVEEIKLGDNDLLAAEVCGLVSAELVILLTGADGVMSDDPRHNPLAERIAQLDVIDERVRDAMGKPSALGTGGMRTKLRAAEVARLHGASTLIAPGRRPGVLRALLLGEDVGTWITPPAESPRRARKRWIGHTLKATGVLRVDEGAERALRGQGSLLFAGVREVEGEFAAGDCVEVRRLEGDHLFARGLVALPAADARRVIGLRTDAARDVLGYPLPDELIHRDNLALLD